MHTPSIALPQLHRRFRQPEAFRVTSPYTLLPMRLEHLDAQRTVLTNMVGEHVVVGREQLRTIIDGTLHPHDPLYGALVSRHLIADATDPTALDLLTVKYRTKHAHLASFTGLHLLVTTLRCDHSCPYCQVSRVTDDQDAFDMSAATASRSIDLLLAGPNRRLKVEFQGGEPLLNFPRLQQIVHEVTNRVKGTDREVQFVVATNLANLTDAMLAFFAEHTFQISTSLDGPADLHNANRPRPDRDSHAKAVEGIARCRAALGHDAVSALMTTTKRSLSQPQAIIDEYVRLGFGSVFLRWLSPFGFATRSERQIGYDGPAWQTFYETGLRYILALNRRGVAIQETYASLILRKMLTPHDTGYVDLQSPAGAVLGALVYNYDGDVYASDEGRMLAEMGDHTFRLGNVHRDTFAQIVTAERVVDLLDTTMTETVPRCDRCGFAPWCGTDPVLHHATQGDMVGHRATSMFCARNLFVFRLLVRILEDEPEHRAILERWAT